jgi:hypothetical protein
MDSSLFVVKGRSLDHSILVEKEKTEPTGSAMCCVTACDTRGDSLHCCFVVSFARETEYRYNQCHIPSALSYYSSSLVNFIVVVVVCLEVYFIVVI